MIKKIPKKELCHYLNDTFLDNVVFKKPNFLHAYISYLKQEKGCLIIDNNAYLQEKENIHKEIIQVLEDAVRNRSIKAKCFNSPNSLYSYIIDCASNNKPASVLTIKNKDRLTHIEHLAETCKIEIIVYYYEEGVMCQQIFNYDYKNSSPTTISKSSRSQQSINATQRFQRMDTQNPNTSRVIVKPTYEPIKPPPIGSSNLIHTTFKPINNQEVSKLPQSSDLDDFLKCINDNIDNVEEPKLQVRQKPQSKPINIFEMPLERDYLKKHPNPYSEEKYSYTVPTTGDSLIVFGNQNLILGKEHGKGGQAKIYECLTTDGYPLIYKNHECVAKIYSEGQFSERDYQKLLKIINFVQQLDENSLDKDDDKESLKSIVFPLSIISNYDNQPVGYIMEKVSGINIDTIVSNRTQLLQNLSNWNRMHLAELCKTIVKTIRTLHKWGIIVGDISGANILLNPASHEIYFIDVDSYQIENFCSPVYTPGFLSKEQIELQEKGLTYNDYSRIEADDDFALAILIFKILMLGKHPYEGRTILDVNEAYKAQLFGYQFGGRILANGELSDENHQRLWRFLPYGIKAMLFCSLSPYITEDGITRVTNLCGPKLSKEALQNYRDANLPNNVYKNPTYFERNRPHTDKWIRALDLYEKQLKIALRVRSILEADYNCTDYNDVETILKVLDNIKIQTQKYNEKFNKNKPTSFEDPLLLDLEPTRDIRIASNCYYYTCDDCGELFSSKINLDKEEPNNNNIETTIKKKLYCPKCYPKHFKTCWYCRRIIPIEYINEDGLCSNCVKHPSPNNKQRLCSCGNYFYLTKSEYKNYINLTRKNLFSLSIEEKKTLNKYNLCPKCRGHKVWQAEGKFDQSFKDPLFDNINKDDWSIEF
ncbi:MAG: hypothetical protein ACI4WH_01635 [Oscillospiraceae bacterium]